MSSTHTLPVNIFNLEGGEIMLARDNENFPGQNWTHDPPNTTCFIGRSNYWNGGSRVRFLPWAWKFPLSWASMVSPPSKLKLFTGNVCVLLTSVSLKLIKIKIKLIYATTSSWEKNKMARERYVMPTDFIFLFMIRVVFFYDPSLSESNFTSFLFFYSIQVGPSRS